MKVTDRQRRARLALRHRLAEPTRGVQRVADAVVGLHSSDPVTVYLSARARTTAFTVGSMERALYRSRSVLRMLGMRRTMFVVPVDLAAAMNTACARPRVDGERKRVLGLIGDQGISKQPARWLRRVERATLEALRARGEATATELSEDVPQLRRKLRFGGGTKWAGEVGLSTRVLFLLATEAEIIRGRPLGSWVSSQYRWAPLDAWVEGGLATPDPREARAELVTRWLRAYGPGTRTDLMWWSGLPAKQTEAALADADAVPVDLDEGRGFVLEDDVATVDDPDPWVALLPGLDPATMGWKERDWYVGDHRAALFDRNGNGGPTIWYNGRIVGAWAQAPDGEIRTRLLEKVDAGGRRMIGDEVERLREWLGESRITSRFPAPLEKELRRDAG